MINKTSNNLKFDTFDFFFNNNHNERIRKLGNSA
jgi:hypothetical protein